MEQSNHKKPYTWEEIEKVIREKLKQTKHIMTFGTIGSLNVEKDIDVIICKKHSSSSSDFYMEVHRIFDLIDEYLDKRYDAQAIRFSFSAEEHILRYLTEGKNDLSFHTMVYTSWPQIEKDWGWALFEGENIKDIILKNYKCLIGSVNDLFSSEFRVEKKSDPLFISLYLYDKINSKYPPKLLVKAMNKYYDYFFRKRLKVKPLFANNEEEVRGIFYELCKTLDSL